MTRDRRDGHTDGCIACGVMRPSAATVVLLGRLRRGGATRVVHDLRTACCGLQQA